MPLLQLALDLDDLDDARRIAKAAAAHVDIIEAGTVLCLACGLEAVRALKADLPAMPVLADLRIARAGGRLAAMAFAAGADIVSVVAEAPAETIRAAAEAARSCGRRIQAELGPTSADDARCAEMLQGLGVTEAIVHSAPEAGGRPHSWRDEAGRISALAAGGLAVTAAGSVDERSAAELACMPLAAVVAGRAICADPEPGWAARQLAGALGRG